VLADAGFTKNGPPRKVHEWYTFDVILNYSLNFPAPVVEQQVAGYAKDGGKSVKMRDGKEKNIMQVSTAAYNECGWRAWLNGTAVTLGMNNIFDADPPFVVSAFENGYDESTPDILGRVWYVALKKRFQQT
jgi:outer membrane receptor protein involved in Fe transport